MENTPRRSRLDLNTPAELAIRKALRKVDKLPPSEKLTAAVVHLNDALNLVGDFVDESSIAKTAPAKELIIELFDLFLLEHGNWHTFKTWIEKKGFNLSEIGMPDENDG